MEKTYRILLIFLLCVVFASCEDNYVSSIPNYPVSMRINLTADHPTFKNTTNQYLSFKKVRLDMDRIGFGGIIICSGIMLDDYGNSIYYAFDMSCPHEVNRNIRVYPMEDALGKLKCEKCGTEYNVGYGFGDPDTKTGPSKEILKRYRVVLNGDFLTVLPR